MTRTGSSNGSGDQHEMDRDTENARRAREAHEARKAQEAAERERRAGQSDG